MPKVFPAVIDAFWDKAFTQVFGRERGDRLEAMLAA
jgi:hypothetical protein